MSEMTPAAAEREILRASRRVARLELVITRFKARLREVNSELRLARRQYRALVQDVTGANTMLTGQSAPSHVRPGYGLPLPTQKE